MNEKVLSALSSNKKIIARSLVVLQVVLGSVFLALMSQASIPLPFSPVPITMQTLAISLLTLALGPRNASMAVVAYLMQATVGMPVLAGGLSDPLWMIGPRSGYLLAFAFAPYAVGFFLRKSPKFSFFKTWLILSVNELFISTVGTFCLGFFVGWEKAFYLGFIPFIPGALFKISIASSCFTPIKFVQSRI